MSLPTIHSVLTSICEHGLMPRSRIIGKCVPGEYDLFCSSNEHLCVNLFHRCIPDKHHFQHQKPGKDRVFHQLRSLVFHPKTGMIPIASERLPPKTFESNSAFLTEITQRVGNTVCLILDANVVDQITHTRHLGFGVDQELKRVVTHEECRTKETLPAERIEAVLSPPQFIGLLEAIFPNTRIIPVPDCESEFELGILHDQVLLEKREADPVERHQNFLAPTRVRTVMPDYNWGLRQLGDELMTKGFLTHIVRLPFESTVEKQEGEKKFLLSFSSGVIEKVVRLVKDPRFRLSKCYQQRPNQYHITCPVNCVEEIETIIKK